MSLFRKNPNEVAYTGGKKHWTDVIKNSGPGELLIWRQPEEDFNTNSTLIVMPGEEAIFIKGGVIQQVFEKGTYTLKTENYPFISRLRNAFSGGISTFNCVVYFVRKAHSFEIRWGTSSPIQVRDKLLGIATKIRCRGSYKVQVENPAKFLEKLVGNNVPMQIQEELNKYFFDEFQSKIKSVIARALNESNMELLGIDSRLDEFSETIEPYMHEILDDYGLRCVKFVVSGADIEDDELRKKYDEIGMDAIAKVRAAQADKAVLDTLGNDWIKLQGVKILGDLANNPGAGGVANVGAGIAMGAAAGGIYGAIAEGVFNPVRETVQQSGYPVQPGGRFVQENAEPVGQSASPAAHNAGEDPVQVLNRMKTLLENGLITQQDYDEKKKEVLSRM